jgi:macrolide transport system ATP-binding/permease protein
MRLLSRVRSWLSAVTRRSRMEGEMDAELRFHIEAFAEDLVRGGVPREEALRRARIEFGGVERAKEECREARGVNFIGSLVQDLRFGLRMLRKNPGFTATAVLALALGIGVNTTVFTAFDGVALRPRPVKDPDRLVGLYRTAERVDHGGLSYPDYVYYRDHSKSLSDLAMWSGATHVTTSDLSVAGPEDGLHVASALGFRLPQLLQAGAQQLNSCVFVSANYFRLLGARPAAGRLFLPEDDQPGAPPVVVLSGNFWQSQFHSNPKVVGSTIHLDRVAFTIVGVAPVDFLGTLSTVPVLWAPIAVRPLLGDGTPENLENRSVGAGIVYGHLKAGISMPDAEAELNVLAAQLRAAYPEVERDSGVRVVSERKFNQIDSEAWPIVAATMGAVALLLLIACANVASLLLARAAARRREIGVRLALGAGRRRLLQQLLIESTLIALLAGAVGLPLASWTLHLLVVEIASAIPSYWGAIALQVTPDIRIFGYTVLISLLTGVVFGLTPALQALRTDVNSALKDNGRVLGQQLSKSRLRDLLIVAQVAACLVLLINSALLLRGSQRALRVDPGFDSKHVVHLSLEMAEPSKGYSQARLFELNRQLMEEIASIPGVTSVTEASRAPISGGNRFVPVGIADAEPPAGKGGEDKRPTAGYSYILPHYFETVGIPMVSGRSFTVQEAETEAPVVVISEATARRFWPGQNPLGKRLAIGSVNAPAPYPGETAPFSPDSEVIGVVRDVHSLFLGKVDESYLYLPLSQARQLTSTLLVHTSRNASSQLPALGSAVRRVDPNLPVVLAPLDWMVSFDPYFVISRIGGILSSIVGVLGLFLACLGVYGMVGYGVMERTHEIGIRMALGARPTQVLGLVLRECARPMLLGTAIGIALSAAVSRLLSAMLFGLNPMDAISFAGVSLLLIAIALFAGWLPSRRAMRLDPMVALRYE